MFSEMVKLNCSARTNDKNKSLVSVAMPKTCCTLQPYHNTSHYIVVFIITQSCHGSQIDHFAICLSK